MGETLPAPFAFGSAVRDKRTVTAQMATFSQELFDAICERIADGESLREICQEQDMPSKASVMRWLAADAALSDQYARAREMQADAIFDEILDIADDATNDWMERKAEKGVGYELNGEHIQRSRVRIDARKWMAGKLRPKVYGDKITHDGTGPKGEITFLTVYETK